MLAKLILFLLLTGVAAPAAAHLDVVFLLDTTGSMSGEIREAKERVTQLGDALRRARPHERIRIGVVAFRDRGDDYVTRVSKLTDDIDDSYRFLATLRADGGGDGPEDILSGLSVAVHEINWRHDERVERQVFLIGDAPPHLDYRDNPTPETLIEQARERRIVVNTIGCRSLPQNGIRFFRDIAFSTEGSYQHIGRVTSGEPGLADAMLRALETQEVAAGDGEPIGLELMASDETVRSAGILIRHGLPDRRATGTCRVSVLLPKGVGLRGVPTATLHSDALVIEIVITQGPGGSQTYKLGRCVVDTTPIRVSFAG